jgi:hypothetical protein
MMNTDESEIAAYVTMYINQLKNTTTFNNAKIEGMAQEFRKKLENDEITVEELVDLQTKYHKRLVGLRGGKLTRRTGKRHGGKMRSGKKTKRRSAKRRSGKKTRGGKKT